MICSACNFNKKRQLQICIYNHVCLQNCSLELWFWEMPNHSTCNHMWLTMLTPGICLSWLDCYSLMLDRISVKVLFVFYSHPKFELFMNWSSSVLCESGLFALLLMVLEWTRPGLSSPLRPICDLRVLDHYIKEAWDAEAAMVRDMHMMAEAVI